MVVAMRMWIKRLNLFWFQRGAMGGVTRAVLSAGQAGADFPGSPFPSPHTPKHVFPTLFTWGKSEEGEFWSWEGDVEGKEGCRGRRCSMPAARS